MLIDELHHLLTGTPMVAAAMARFDFGDGVQAPAIFTTDPAPEDADAPFLVIVQDGGLSGRGTRSSRRANPTGTATLWGDFTRSDRSLLALAEMVWRKLDRCELTVSGFGLAFIAADFPQKTRDGQGYPGYVINWSAILHE